MAVMVEGAEMATLNMVKDKGEVKLSGTYRLMSNAGKVLAKQDFGGGYNSMEISWSPATLGTLKTLLASMQQDLATTLGLNEETHDQGIGRSQVGVGRDESRG